MTEDREVEEAVRDLNEIRLGRGQLRELGYARQRLIETAVEYEMIWNMYMNPSLEQAKGVSSEALRTSHLLAHNRLLRAIDAYNQIVQAQYAGH